MENPIRTNNIISTPNITGNIGSCTTQLTTVYTRSGYFSNEGMNITTNSCTGEATQTHFTELGGIGIMFGMGALIFAILMVCAIRDSLKR